MDANPKILVFGATGQQGGAVARALAAAGRSVRAFARNPGSERGKALSAEGMEVVAGDLADRHSIDRAMAGVYGVFSVQPSLGQGTAYDVTDADEVRFGTGIADAAANAGVRHLVYSSMAAAGKGRTGMGHFDSKTEIENHIRSLDLPFTIVRPSTFMEILMLPGMGLDRGVFTFLMKPETPLQIIAVDDIGRIVAGIYADPGRHRGMTLEISGDELTGPEFAAALSRASRRTITYARFPETLLGENAFLGRLAALVEDGRCAGQADIAALRKAFDSLQTFEEWLAGPGKPLLTAALDAPEAAVALR